jgi:hypothetical protein
MKGTMMFTEELHREFNGQALHEEVLLLPGNECSSQWKERVPRILTRNAVVFVPKYYCSSA